jgi:hypothetical protein
MIGSETAIASVLRTVPAVWRLAADEGIMLCGPGEEDARARELSERHGESLVVADRDSFSAWSVIASDVEDALSRLCAIPPPRERPVLIQGLVADLPAKVLLGRGRAAVLVPSTAGHHLQARAASAWDALAVKLGEEPVIFDPRGWA